MIKAPLFHINFRLNGYGSAGFHLFLLTFVFLIGLTACFSQIPAFPGAEGGGAVAIGGRGGKVIEVTNLNDSGPGSFRQAVEVESGPRTVVFRVGGTINVKSRILITNPYLTIAGQTAPGGGIQLRGDSFYDNVISLYRTHDIVIRYLRLRKGYSPPKCDKGNTVNDCQVGDNLNILDGCYNIIVDHCSASWGMDESLSCWSSINPNHNITFSWNIVGETLNEHSTGTALGSNIDSENMKDIDIIKNFYTNTSHRLPLVKVQRSRLINNIIYNFKWYATGFSGGVDIDIIGNWYKRGPMEIPQGRAEIAWESSYLDPNTGPKGWPSIYIKGNKGYTIEDPDADNWPMLQHTAAQDWSPLEEPLDQKYRRYDPMNVTFGIEIFDANNLRTKVLSKVGAYQRLNENGNWEYNRDAVDRRYINEFDSIRGQIPVHENEVGGYPNIASGTAYVDSDHDGMPDRWESYYGLNTYNASDRNKDLDNDGYTNLEEFLNGTKPHESQALSNPNDPNLQTSIAIGASADQNAISVYPNPVENTFRVMGMKADAPYWIYSSKGNLVKKGRGNTIDISNLPQGIYLLVSNQRRAKFIKK